MGIRKTFRLDKQGGKFMRVCAGIAAYTGIDATFIRIGAVALTVLGGFPWTLIAYGVIAWIAKPAPYGGDDLAMPRVRLSTHELRTGMRDIDHRMAEVENYVTSSNSSLAREIDELR